MSAGGSKAAPEVIQEWADGEGVYTFERGRMEAAVRNICLEKPVHLQVVKPTKPAIKLNREDVDFIIKELKVSKAEAEEVLAAHEGNVSKALIQLMTPPSATVASSTKTTTSASATV